MKVTLLSLLWALILCAISVNGKLEGQQCNTAENLPGVCTRVSRCCGSHSCPHNECGRENLSTIVCCPQPATTTTIQPATTTTSQPATTTTPQPETTTTSQPETTTSNRISAKKCNEYKEFVYNVTAEIRGMGEKFESKVSNCAFESQGLILGGEDAQVGEFPHMALIGFEVNNTTRWACGGSLISEQFVLTAAHCVAESEFGQPKYVRLGVYDQKREDDGTIVELKIIEWITHYNYTYTSFYDDIGLLKLESPVDFSGAIRPACLPEQPVQYERAIASGWGDVQYRGKGSHVLQKVILEIFSQSKCDDAIPTSSQLKAGIIEETQVCYGSDKEPRDTCQGDSGGPLQVYHTTHNCTYTIVGVTSYGQVCGIVGVPGVYTRVYPYLDWIVKTVWPNSSQEMATERYNRI